MIVSQDGYSIEYYKNHNKIVISLPQTIKTLTNTTDIVRNRKVDLEYTDLALLLELTRYLCK